MPGLYWSSAMSDELFGELVVFMFVALPGLTAGTGRGKQVALARIPCVREDAKEKFAEFRAVNSSLPEHRLTARWTASEYL